MPCVTYACSPWTRSRWASTTWTKFSIENFVQVVDAHLDLVQGLQAYVTHGIGTPQKGDDTLQFAQPGSVLAWSHLDFVIVGLQQFGHLARLGNQAAARGFGGVRGKHQFYRELAKELLDAVSIHVVALERFNKCSERA